MKFSSGRWISVLFIGLLLIPTAGYSQLVHLELTCRNDNVSPAQAQYSLALGFDAEEGESQTDDLDLGEFTGDLVYQDDYHLTYEVSIPFQLIAGGEAIFASTETITGDTESYAIDLGGAGHQNPQSDILFSESCTNCAPKPGSGKKQYHDNRYYFNPAGPIGGGALKHSKSFSYTQGNLESKADAIHDLIMWLYTQPPGGSSTESHAHGIYKSLCKQTGCPAGKECRPTKLLNGSDDVTLQLNTSTATYSVSANRQVLPEGTVMNSGRGAFKAKECKCLEPSTGKKPSGS